MTGIGHISAKRGVIRGPSDDKAAVGEGHDIRFVFGKGVRTTDGHELCANRLSVGIKDLGSHLTVRKRGPVIIPNNDEATGVWPRSKGRNDGGRLVPRPVCVDLKLWADQRTVSVIPLTKDAAR